MQPATRDDRRSAPADRVGGRLAAQVYEQLKERLLDGRYAPRERVRVTAIGRDFEVSKQPVMEALRRLSGDGLVEIIPQVGCRVAAYDGQEIADFFVLFGAFEGTIAAAAAVRRTEAQLRELDRVSARIAALPAAADPVGWRDYRLLNREYHAVIHAMAHSRMMAEMTGRMWDLSDFLITTTQPPRPLAATLRHRHDGHERIRAALLRGDAATARREMEAHIVSTVDASASQGRAEPQAPT